MSNAGRICLVALPFVATLVAFLLLLVATLGGKHVKSVYMFEVDLSELSIGSDAISSLVSSVVGDNVNLTSLTSRDEYANILARDNITAADLALDNYYYINVWGRCSGDSPNDTTCTDPEWNWASKMINTTYLEQLGHAMGANVSLPSSVKNGLEAFNTSIKWLQIILAVALALLGTELLLGIFTSCSRLMSCLTWVASGLATAATVGSAVVATVVTVTVVGVIKGAALAYGLQASVNTTFLALVWASAALCIISGFFWCISACCCSPEKRENRRGIHHEKDYLAGDYQPLGAAQMSGANHHAGPHHTGAPSPQMQSSPYGVYEPYSHRT